MDVNAPPQPFLTEISNVPVIATPQGWQLSVLTSLAEKQFVQAPSAVERIQTVQNNESFDYYDRRFSDESSLYTVSRKRQQVTAYLDFHKDPATPARTAHKLIRQFSLSKSFQAWLNANKTQMSQVDFANFLEDRISDLSTSPGAPTTQADLLNAVLQFKANQNSVVNAATNLTNGDVEFQFANNTSVTSTQFPTRLLLLIQVYEHGAQIEVPARLKFRLKEGVLTFWYELIRLEEFMETVFANEVELLRGAIGDKFFVLED